MIETNFKELGAEAYDEIYGRSEAYGLQVDIQDRYKDLYKKIISNIGDGERILDVGCGTGQLAKKMQGKGLKYARGIDISEVGIKIARERCPDLDFQVADIWKYDFGKDDYDTIVLCEVLEHLEEDLEFLELIPRGKKIIISDPNAKGKGHIRIMDTLDETVKRYQHAIEIKNTAIAKYKKTRFFIVIGDKK